MTRGTVLSLLLLVLPATAQAQHVILFSLHPQFALPELATADLDRELAQFERIWEQAANVDVRRTAWPNGVRFVSGRASLPGGKVALGLAYPQRGEVLIHNGTRGGGRTDYWRTAPGLVAAVFAHELWHIVFNSTAHASDRNCIMNSDAFARKFCPVEVATLQRRYGRPKPLDVAGTFRVAALGGEPVVFGDGRYAGLVGYFDGKHVGLGLYDPVASVFHIRYTLTPGPADVSFAFGPPGKGWQPLVADFDWDGDQTCGLYDPSTSTFYLRNELAAGKADQVIQFGSPGAQALNGLLGTYARAK